MDFGEYVRGGTAPISGKAKISSSLNPAVPNRPKTRAVDSDIQDTNIDLKVNRLKNGAFSPSSSNDPYYAEEMLNDKEIARISLNEWNDSNRNDASRNNRAPSRGKKSKDPTRKENTLMSGLSAYTQNMPAIVLNTNRKSHKGPTASPRTAKESKNISQINELRAAYGADIPIGKPNSPPGKTRKPNSAEINNVKPLDGVNKTNLEPKLGPPPSASSSRRNTADNLSVASSAASSNKDIEVIERGRELTSNRSTVSSSSEISHSPSRKTKKSNSLLKASFSSKHSDESNYEGGNNIEQTSSTSPTDGVDGNGGRTSVTAPSPDHVLIPVDDFLNDVIEKGNEQQQLRKNKNKQNTLSPATNMSSNRATASNSPDSVPQQHPLSLAHPASNLISFSVSDYTLGAVDNTADEVFADLNDHEIPEDEIIPAYDSDEKGLIKQSHMYISEENAAGSILGHQPKPRSYSEDPSSSAQYRARVDDPIDATGNNGGGEEEYDETNEEISPRPQSRKLYLGSEKPSSMRDTKNKNAVPRSAGARYGAYSPIKGGMEQPPNEIGPKTGASPRNKKSQFKKLSSHGDLADWIDETQVDMRPPSRQSTAFPVHLSSEPGTTGTSPGAIVQPATMNKMEIITKEPDHEIAESPASVRSARQPVAVNTEPRTVKKVSSGIKGEEEKKTMAAAGSSGSGNNLPSTTTPGSGDPVPVYNVRPPSRQKVAAQHLFDNENAAPTATLHDNPSVETISMASRRSSRNELASAHRKLETASGDVYTGNAESGSTNRLRTATGHRPTSTRGKPSTSSAYEYDDYNDDGFADLDPNDNVAPFPITINYGNNNNMEPMNVMLGAGNLKAVSSDSRSKNSANMNVNTNQKIFVEDYPVDNSNNNSNLMGYGGVGKVRKANHMSPRNQKDTSEHSNLRPKSVTAISGNSAYPTVGGAGGGPVGGGKYSAKSPALNYDVRQEENTLRSKSANNYAAHHRLYNPVHSNDGVYPNNGSGMMGNNSGNTPYLPSKPTKGNPNPPSSSQNIRTRAWGDQPDPRNIPRAQNVFGMEADTGWTSPALLGNPFSSTTINDNFVVQDDDEMTILTEESGGYNMDNSLSLQSFNIETSLDEDFLKLFAPGR